MFEQSEANSRHLDAAVPIDLPNRERPSDYSRGMSVSRMRGGKRYPHFLSPLQFATPPGMALESLGGLECISETAASWALEVTTR